MKKTLLTAVAIALTVQFSYAQFTGGPTGPIYYNSGDVGIGTTTPSSLLSVGGAGSSRYAIHGEALGGAGIFDVGVNGVGSGYGLVGNSASGTGVYGSSSGSGTAGYFYSTSGYGLIVQKGNVGIGTTSPAAKLDVNGDIYSSTRIIADIFGGYSGGNVTLSTNTGGSAALVFNTSLTEQMRITAGGSVLIGKTSLNTGASYKLDVAGATRADKVVVNTTGADFVFEPGYNLPKLSEVKNYIDQNHHLPEIPSALEMQKDGMDVGELNKKLLQKVEELTLYLIVKDKQLNQQQVENTQQNKRIAALEDALSKLTLNK